jgi:hypothetical protein
MVDSLGITFPLSQFLLTRSGGWERRLLKFGVEDGYSIAALTTYLAQKSGTSLEKTRRSFDNAAHASVTGVGLLLLVKTSNLDIPINIINLVLRADLRLTSDVQADVTDVFVKKDGHFTVEAGLAGRYEFDVVTFDRAQKWKKEIEQQCKLRPSDIPEYDRYKESYAYFLSLTGISSLF